MTGLKLGNVGILTLISALVACSAPQGARVPASAETLAAEATAAPEHTVKEPAANVIELPPAPPPPVSTQENSHSWKIVVLSDIHVNTKSVVHPRFQELVPCLVELAPRAVVITGDSTNGNKKDRYHREPDILNSWWDALHVVLKPFYDAGIPVFPVAGNHDYYEEGQQKAYQHAWRDLQKLARSIELSGNPPLYYSANIDGVHLSLLHIVDREIEPDVAKWFDADLEKASSARLRFAFGHEPLISRISNARFTSFERSLGSQLARGNFDAYFTGHEHIVWDEELTIDGKPLRQVIVGTASATYTFGIGNKKAFQAHCDGAECKMPYGGGKFRLQRTGRKQQHEQAFYIIEITPTGYSAAPYTFARNTRDREDFTSACKGDILPFYEE